MQKIYKIKKNKINFFYLKPFKDKRGEFYELYNKKLFNKKIKKIVFVEDDLSISKKNVFRGFHSDKKAWKLLTCIHGKVIFYFLSFMEFKKKKISLTKKNVSDMSVYSFLIPPNIGVAYFTVSKKAIISYKQSEYYDIKRQDTISINDNKIKKIIRHKNIIISKRDKKSDINI